jgi:dTDP-4-amino-4,6-dideoxygalactose transaminase
MDFIDLAAQQKRIKDKIDANIQKVLGHGNYIMGPEVKELEKRLAEYVGAKYAISCASGTDALLMALMAYEVGPDDAIFTTPFTFIATAEVISLLGATPVFVDIDPKTFNIDPAKLALAIKAVKANDPSLHPLPESKAYIPSIIGKAGNKKITSPLMGEGQSEGGALRPRGVIAVDLFGLLADYESIEAIAQKNGLFVIEDAAQSFGAEYKGEKSCSFGNIACTSFFPAKPLGCYGDGGMCFTDDDQLAQAMNSIRIHGKGSDKYDNVRIGINGRLDTLQAAILLAKFDIFPEEIELRQQVARGYSKLLSKCLDLVPPFPFSNQIDQKSAWAQYSLLTESDNQRNEIMNKLKSAGIPTAIYYPKPLHLQTAFAHLRYKTGDFPISEDCARRIFSVPMHPYLTEQDQIKIAEAIKS